MRTHLAGAVLCIAAGTLACSPSGLPDEAVPGASAAPDTGITIPSSCPPYPPVTLPTGCALTPSLIQAFQSRGYTVQQGTVWFGASCNAQSTSCQFNNPTTPYGHYELPPSPNDPSPPGNASKWQLGADEAVVFCGYTPAQATYYSWRSYVAHGYDPYTGVDESLDASLGDSTNLEVLSTAGLGTDAVPTLIVTTGNQWVDQQVVRPTFASAGVDPAAMSTDVIPEDSKYVSMGFGTDGDTFDMLIRIALPANAGQESCYEGPWGTAIAPGTGSPYATVYRITPGASAVIPTGYAYKVPPLRPLEPTVDEVDAPPTGLGLQGAVTTLGAAIQARYGNTGTPYGTRQDTSYGYACLQSGHPCDGDNRDALYSGSGAETLYFGGTNGANDGPDAPDFYVVYGVYHTNVTTSGGNTNAVYTNVDVNDVNKQLGVLAETSSLVGSAQNYEPGASDQLYAWEFARTCALPGGGTQPNCSAVPITGFPAVAQGDKVSFIERAYLDSATHTRPDPSVLVAPQILYFPHR